jgi:hypothetical protein
MDMSRSIPFKRNSSSVVKLLLLLCVLIPLSCVPQSASSGRKKSSSGAETSVDPTPEVPTFSGTANTLQNGNVSSATTTRIPGDFSTSLYLRGSKVDTFIKSDNQNTVQCLFIPFTQTSVQRVLIAAAVPRFFLNFTTNTQEFYYLLEPANTSQNTTFCQKAEVLGTSALSFPGSTPVFDLSSVCPNCSLTSVLSDPISLSSQNGLTLTEVQLLNLRIEITSDSGVTTPGGQSCTTSSECISKGFDCCSFGQCVRDKEVRSDIDQTSTGFLQALLDIGANPSSITDYPEYFHLCSIDVPVNATPTPAPDPNVEAAQRIKRLKALYDCTTPIEGELAICETNFTDVQSIITQTGTNQFATLSDDRNFNSIYAGSNALPLHSIFKVVYADETLFENNTIIKGMTIGPGGNGTGNDNLDDTQVINLTHTPAASASNDNLNIQYKIDGSCEAVSPFLAKCFKQYVQGQNLSKVTDHFPASNEFILPFYADSNKTITVDVDDSNQLQGTDWNLVQTTPARIQFTGTELKVFDTQVVKINFFVNLQNFPNVLLAKDNALDEIKTICACGTELDCRLEEQTNTSGVVEDYTCVYPSPPLPPPPLQQTVLFSAKTVPHRYFDKDGVYQEEGAATTREQEGTEFAYTGGDFLKPNNVDTYIGFNEIYGSFTTNGTSAVPAKEVRVTNGKTYDIYVNSGSFSTCFFCGTDYYSNLARIFPSNFTTKGGGYTPDLQINDALATKNLRKDDLLFGRACFVPATMIPWTHTPSSSRQNQRTGRLAAQHFMFANGYNRDWYGFDYGSLIGSFDGVKWFSIGNQRRVQARSNKLFIAINGYFGDLTSSTTYSVTVQDNVTSAGNTSIITSDFESSGAECQKAHECSTDSDCASQLGWEYTCESITAMTSRWPRFDSNALEVPGASDTVNLRAFLGATTGSNKRCVYRGRGAACIGDYTTTDANSTFTGTTQRGLHACSQNNYCQSFIEGVAVPSFNNKIARFAKSVKSQNASDSVIESTLDVIGLGARILGRPFAWRGTDTIPTSAQSNLSQNDVTAMCIPGRDRNDDTLFNNHTNKPTSDATGDQINAMGVTPDLVTGNSGGVAHYLSSCSILDEDGDYIFKSPSGSISESSPLSSSAVANIAARQALPTNSLAIFESDSMTGNQIIKNFEEEFIEEISYQENRCLRAPGSTCFSNLDCAPNPFIADRIGNINTDDSSVTDILNAFEIKFWQEELICSQDKLVTDPDFSLGDNRCCREIGKDLTIGTATIDPANTADKDLDFGLIPGVTTSINSQTRNSRLSTVWDLINPINTNYPQLRTVKDDQCGLSGCADPVDVEKQFNTFNEMAARTCCSKNWVRNFNRDDNGGGHTWGPDKTQQIPKESFRCYNYLRCSGATCGDDDTADFAGYSCSHTDSPTDPACLARSVPEGEANIIFEWLGSMELTGIPQIAIKNETHTDIICQADPDDQSALASGAIAPNLLNLSAVEEFEDTQGRYLKASDTTNFQTENVRQIFSPDTASCCLPAGTTVAADADPDTCCTGYIGAGGTCQLPDYSDVSLYLNRYISSEAQDEVLGAFDPQTGYLNSTVDVIRIACSRKICESGLVVPGVALSNLRTRGHEADVSQRKRFIDGDDDSNNFSGLNTLYDRGLRWNTHIYCSDDELENPPATQFDCSSF